MARWLVGLDGSPTPGARVGLAVLLFSAFAGTFTVRSSGEPATVTRAPDLASRLRSDAPPAPAPARLTLAGTARLPALRATPGRRRVVRARAAQPTAPPPERTPTAQPVLAPEPPVAAPPQPAPAPVRQPAPAPVRPPAPAPAPSPPPPPPTETFDSSG